MTVGEKIRKFRIDQGYTQKELAIMSGLSESAIRNYELGNLFISEFLVHISPCSNMIQHI